ncbi:MAG TPA: ABC transporter ATP-binding protein [Polyangiaceae bacterium]
MAEEKLLSVVGAKKEFGDRVKTVALAAADFSLKRGEFVALVGPSGSGKSTLLNLIGLLDRPTAGQIILAGQDTTGLDDATLTALRGRMLGFVFQFHHLLPAFTAVENVMLPEWADAGFASTELRARAEALLREVGLADRMGYRANDLSGGQQQRVAIARALARTPPIVLADEPTGNLDTESSNEVFRLMRRFNVESHTTFLIVTHDPRVSEQCDRVIELIDGRIHSDSLTPSRGAH